MALTLYGAACPAKLQAQGTSRYHSVAASLTLALRPWIISRGSATAQHGRETAMTRLSEASYNLRLAAPSRLGLYRTTSHPAVWPLWPQPIQPRWLELCAVEKRWKMKLLRGNCYFEFTQELGNNDQSEHLSRLRTRGSPLGVDIAFFGVNLLGWNNLARAARHEFQAKII